MSSGKKLPYWAKDVFTTGDIAAICSFSLRKVCDLFDEGTLKGYRVPGSRFRRVPREEFEKFIHENELPEKMLPRARVLIATTCPETAAMLSAPYERHPRFARPVVVSDVFSLGNKLAEMQLVLLDLDHSFIDPRKVQSACDELEPRPGLVLLTQQWRFSAALPDGCLRYSVRTAEEAFCVMQKTARALKIRQAIEP